MFIFVEPDVPVARFELFFFWPSLLMMVLLYVVSRYEQGQKANTLKSFGTFGVVWRVTLFPAIYLLIGYHSHLDTVYAVSKPYPGQTVLHLVYPKHSKVSMQEFRLGIVAQRVGCYARFVDDYDEFRSVFIRDRRVCQLLRRERQAALSGENPYFEPIESQSKSEAPESH